MITRKRQALRRCLVLALVLIVAFGVYKHGIARGIAERPRQNVGLSRTGRAVDISVGRNLFAVLVGDGTSDISRKSVSASRCCRHQVGNDTTHYKMVVGILSAKRNPPTVVRMAKELVSQVTEPGEYKFLTWMSHSAAGEKDIAHQLRELGVDVYVNNESYPELEPGRIRITFKDSLERMKWRTAHVLDYANLLECALNHDSEYILILEDDLKPAKHALDKIYKVLKEQLSNHPEWGILTLFGNRYRLRPLTKVTRAGSSGGCAMVLKKTIIAGFIDYVRSDPYLAPVDLLLATFIERNKLQVYERSPNLFQHVSPHSSYYGKDQKKRSTERVRSISFVYDEDNKTLAAIPSRRSDGYIGCFVDYNGPERRDLSGLFAFRTGETEFCKGSPALCRKFCKHYLYFGLQNGGDCHCGNEFGQYGWAPESDCNMTCIQQEHIMCGGTFRNSVYSVK